MEIDDGKGNFSFDGTEPDNDVDEPENVVADDDNDFSAEHTWDGHSQPDLDSFDNIDDFDTAVEKYEAQEQEFQSGIIPEIQTPPPGDDEQGHKRRGFFKELETYDRERALAEAAGDTEQVRRWDERASLVAKDLNKLPPTPQAKYEEQKQSDMMTNAFGKLFSKDMRYDPIWNEKSMQRDAAVLVADYNKQSEKGIVLPDEVGGRFGNLSKMIPQNAVKFDLTPELMDEYKMHMSGIEASDTDSVLKASWAWVHAKGIEGLGIRSVPLTKREKKSAKEAGQKPPSFMNQKEYEHWRNSGGK